MHINERYYLYYKYNKILKYYIIIICLNESLVLYNYYIYNWRHSLKKDYFYKSILEIHNYV